jgi:hypothetical protein
MDGWRRGRGSAGGIPPARLPGSADCDRGRARACACCCRFAYSREFLRWALLVPGHLKEWHTGVRVTKSRKLVAFISAVPASIRVNTKWVPPPPPRALPGPPHAARR